MPKRIQHILSAAVAEEVALSIRAVAHASGISVSEFVREALVLRLRQGAAR